MMGGRGVGGWVEFRLKISRVTIDETIARAIGVLVPKQLVHTVLQGE